jgi:hypothetical protein
MPMLGVVVGALVWSLLAWTGTATAADDDRHRQVLLLYAESRLLPAIVSADATFRSTLSSNLGAPVDFRTEFLDLPATPNAPYERRLRDLLRLKYEGVHFDLVVVLAVRALRIALDYRGELAPGAPVVFMAVDAIDLPELPPDVTGVLLNLDWMDTLGAALRLQPETRHVVVVGGRPRSTSASWPRPGRHLPVCRRRSRSRISRDRRWRRWRRSWLPCPRGPS